MIPWLTSSAESWRAARRSSRPIAWGLTVGWIGIVTGLAFTAPVGTCTLEAPCGTEPLFAVMLACLVAGLVGLHRSPGVALVCLPLAGWIEVTQDPDAGSYGMWATPALVLVSVATIGYTGSVLVGCQRQRSMAAAVAQAGPVVVAPEGVRPTSWWVLGLWTERAAGAIGATVLGVAVLGYAGFAWRADAEHASAATTQVGVVRSVEGDGLVLHVVMPDGDVRSVGTADGSVYPIGSDVPVLLDGSWSRLATEPYDATLWLASGLALLIAAGSLALGVLRSVRAVAGLAQPHHGLGVLAGEDGQGRALIWAADARPEDRPLFELGFVPYSADDNVSAPPEDDAPAGLPELEAFAEELRRRDPGILHAIPFDGGVVPVEVHPPDGDPVMLVPLSPIRPVRGSADPAADVEEIVTGRSLAASRIGTTGTPRVYEVSALGRAGVLMAWVGMLALGAWVVTGPDGPGPMEGLILWSGGVWGCRAAVLAMGHKVVADAAGVRVHGLRGWQSRSWDELSMAGSSATTVLLVTHEEARTLETSARPGMAALRHIGVRNPAERCADEINAMISDPGLRPRIRWQSSGKTSLVGYVAVAVVMWTAAVGPGLASGLP